MAETSAARFPSRGLAAAVLSVVMVGVSLSVGPSAASSVPDARPAVIGVRAIGHSVDGRKIIAYRVGERTAAKTVVAIAAIHGNERAPRTTLREIRDGRPVTGVDLWLILRANPDGVAARDRHNARGVDLNRNFPTRWQATTGYYYSGPRPASEPETRALMRFLDNVDPDHVVSFHQPLYGVDTSGDKDRRFARRLARELALPRSGFTCSGACHGTLTQWFNRHHAGANITVEYGADPSWRYLHKRSPNGLLRAVGGAR